MIPQDDAVELVLLVEDEALVRLVAAELLQEAGFEVVEAGDVREAVDALRSAGTLSAAILDFSLPDGSAEELARELRAACPGLPLVIASGHAEAELRARFGGFDGVAFVGKPYESRALLDALRGLGTGLSARLPAS